MSFLDVIPAALFRMLGASAHARNAAVLERIFEQFFDDFALAPTKAEVLQVIQQVLDDAAFAGTIDEDSGPLNGPTDNVLYNRLREDGWIMEVENRRKIEVHMPREAHALLSALATLKEELRVDISAEASLIDSGIMAAYQDPAGKVMDIGSARRKAIALRRSIDGVLTSLHRIEAELMQSDGLADLLAKFMDRFVDKLLLANYRALKTSAYNPMRFQRSICANTERFINDAGQIARAAVALADEGMASDMQSAQAQILQDLGRIHDVFANLGEKLDMIDRFSHKLERRIATTVRYQETSRSVRDEALRSAIRMGFARWDQGEADCITPLVTIPVPYATATLALPRKAREPVTPQARVHRSIDPADALRESMMDAYATSMDVTAQAVLSRLLELAPADSFYDLDRFVPQNARDVAILYEARTGALESSAALEVRVGDERHAPNPFVSGPSLLIRRRQERGP